MYRARLSTTALLLFLVPVPEQIVGTAEIPVIVVRHEEEAARVLEAAIRD
jgi:nucleotide-binding universal stress UspA family protein